MKVTKAKTLTLHAKTVQWSAPPSWRRAVGILKGKSKAIERHIKTIRAEWDRRIPYDD